MPTKPIDITNQKFGRLTALNFDSILSSSGKDHVWLFKCECGQIVPKAKNEVVRGKTSSCGLRCPLRSRNKTGQRFGSLVVLGEGEDIFFSGRNRRTWLCECDCGNQVSIPRCTISCRSACSNCAKKLEDLTNKVFGEIQVLKLLKTNRTQRIYLVRCSCGKEQELEQSKIINRKSCGCRKLRTGKHNARYRGYEDLNKSYWNQLLQGANKRNLEFSVSMEYAWSIFLSQNKKCYISGLDIYFSPGKGKRGTASLDRIDSSKGYIKGNIQWVHKDYNELKWDKSLQELIQMCRTIINYQDSLKNE